ncbi:MAG: hypothetical protein ACI8P9_004424 [Parasphingorhabdus sp.]|jgi:hypothetical protein
MEKQHRSNGRIAFILSAIFFLTGAGFFLWALSSSHLAFAACDGTYSLGSENIRCKRPVIFAYSFYGCAVAFIGSVITGLLQQNKHKRSTKNSKH